MFAQYICVIYTDKSACGCLTCTLYIHNDTYARYFSRICRIKLYIYQEVESV